LIYDDFVIQLSPIGEERFTVRVIRSPAGEGEGAFEIPFDLEALKPVMTNLTMRKRLPSTGGNTTLPWFRERMSDTESAAVRLTLKKLGGMLYRGLFRGEVEARLLQSLSITEQNDRGLRIVFRVDVRDASVAELFSLPWEYLYREESGDFLTLSRRTPLVRYLTVPRPPGQVGTADRLRILAVCAAPNDMSDLSLEVELGRITDNWSSQPGVTVEPLVHGNLVSLRRKLLEKEYHVVHFMGHGDWDDARQTGLLYMERADGTSEPVSGERFATFLKDFKSIRMVFLNACTSGEIRAVNPFAGVASALVLGGVPAVLAMQFPISDHAAIILGNAIYGRLAAGDPLDAALTEGRFAIHAVDEKSTEWGTPVCFSRMPADFRMVDGTPRPETRVPINRPPEATTSIYPITSVPRGRGKPTPRETQKRKHRWRWFPPLLLASSAVTVVVYPEVFSLDRLYDSPEPRKSEKTVEPLLVPSDNLPGQLKKLMLPGGIELVFAWVPAGRFMMGSHDTEPGNTREELRHPVTITRGFWLTITEITQAQWTALGLDNHSEHQGPDLPVTDVSWPKAKDYADQLAIHFGMFGFRLPTEAEWEYACRAGTESMWAGDVEDMAWFSENAEGRIHPVMSKQPNAWGLFDMHGNVWEWCLDWWSLYPDAHRIDPREEGNRVYKILRGGSYLQNKKGLRSANRYRVGAESRGEHVGSRVVLEE